jgi:hypothetical protein
MWNVRKVREFSEKFCSEASAAATLVEKASQKQMCSECLKIINIRQISKFYFLGYNSIMV